MLAVLRLFVVDFATARPLVENAGVASGCAWRTPPPATRLFPSRRLESCDEAEILRSGPEPG